MLYLALLNIVLRFYLKAEKNKNKLHVPTIHLSPLSSLYSYYTYVIIVFPLRI